MAKPQMQLLDLPTEILLHILTPFPTNCLLPLACICRPVHNLVLRILHYRLLLAARDPSYLLILEAYHPSRRWTRPYLYCTYLGTDGLSSTHEGVGALYNEQECEDIGALGKLGKLYSSFRPEHPKVEGEIPARRIAGAAPVLPQNLDGNDPNGSRSVPVAAGTPAMTPMYKNAGDGGAKKVVYTISLDDGELFGQFCVYAQLVSGFRRRGIFDHSVNVVEPGSGTIRIWRQWLLDRWKESREGGAGNAYDDDASVRLQRTSTINCPNARVDPTILWTDSKRNVGLKVQVQNRDLSAHAKTPEQLEEEPLSCDLTVQELVVRTTHLMLAVEDAAAASEANNGSGKALVFGSFASRIGPT